MWSTYWRYSLWLIVLPHRTNHTHCPGREGGREIWRCEDWFKTLRLRQNGRRFADDTFKRIFLNENVRISIKISLKFVPKGPIKNNPALVQIMAWRRSGDKPLSEPMMVSSLTHICVTRPHWFNALRPQQNYIFKCIFFNENGAILIQISQKYIPGCPIVKSSLV